MQTIKKGDRVSVDYEGRFEDGKVFDSSTHAGHSHPLIFVAGEGQVIKGFDSAIIGMHEGEEKEFKVSPAEGYGERDPRLQEEVPKAEMNFPPEMELKAGMTLVMQTPMGERVPVNITAVTDKTVTLDLNHPLAGKTLIFKIKIAGVNDTVKEDSHAHH